MDSKTLNDRAGKLFFRVLPHLLGFATVAAAAACALWFGANWRDVLVLAGNSHMGDVSDSIMGLLASLFFLLGGATVVGVLKLQDWLQSRNDAPVDLFEGTP